MAYHDTEGACRTITTARCMKSGSSTCSGRAVVGSRFCAKRENFRRRRRLPAGEDRALQREESSRADERTPESCAATAPRSKARSTAAKGYLKIMEEGSGVEISLGFGRRQTEGQRVKTTARYRLDATLDQISERARRARRQFVGRPSGYAFCRPPGGHRTIGDVLLQ